MAGYRRGGLFDSPSDRDQESVGETHVIGVRVEIKAPVARVASCQSCQNGSDSAPFSIIAARCDLERAIRGSASIYAGFIGVLSAISCGGFSGALWLFKPSVVGSSPKAGSISRAEGLPIDRKNHDKPTDDRTHAEIKDDPIERLVADRRSARRNGGLGRAIRFSAGIGNLGRRRADLPLADPRTGDRR